MSLFIFAKYSCFTSAVNHLLTLSKLQQQAVKILHLSLFCFGHKWVCCVCVCVALIIIIQPIKLVTKSFLLHCQ